MHCICRAVGVPSPLQYLGETCVLLAGQCAVCRLYGLPNNHLVKHGRVHAPLLGKRTRFVGLQLLAPPCYISSDRRNSTAYCWGNFAGPFVVKEPQAPYYEGASIGLLVGYSIKLGCHVLLLGMFYWTRKIPAAQTL